MGSVCRLWRSGRRRRRRYDEEEEKGALILLEGERDISNDEVPGVFFGKRTWVHSFLVLDSNS